jgi:isopentenyldiphosphate isomerase
LINYRNLSKDNWKEGARALSFFVILIGNDVEGVKIMEEEIFEIYDSQKNKTGKTGIRDVRLQNDEYRFAVMAVVFNKEGKILVQKRTSNKYVFPDMWDYAAAGGAVAREELYKSCERELFEEMGIRVDLSKTQSRMTFSFSEGWTEVYMLELDISEKDLTLQESEVSEAKFLTEDEYLELVESGEFIHYIFAKSIFDFYRSNGAHFENDPSVRSWNR